MVYLKDRNTESLWYKFCCSGLKKEADGLGTVVQESDSYFLVLSQPYLSKVSCYK